MRRSVPVVVAAAVALGLLCTPPADAAKRRRHRCGPTSTQVRCLAKLRGAEPLAVLPSGRVPRSAALQAFAAHLAPLPGVKVRRGASGRTFFGSGILRAALMHRRSMTRAQRKVVDRYLTRTRAPGRRRATAAVTVPPGETEKWEALVAQARVRLDAALGVALEQAPIVQVMPWDAADKEEGATTGPALGGGCRIDVHPVAWADAAKAGTPAGDYVATHELMHCYELQLQGKAGYLRKGLGWVNEGGADWAAMDVLAVAGEDLTGVVTLRQNWDDWLLHPDKPLFARSYSAAGFFAHLDASGGDGWKALRRMLEAHSAAEAYALAGDGFVDSWASSYYRAPAFGPGWDAQGPFITAARPPIDKDQEVAEGDKAVVAAAAHSAAQRELTLSAEVIEVSGGARGRLLDAGGTERGLGEAAYCARADGCAIRPAGCAPLPAVARGLAHVAVTGHRDGGRAVLRGRSLDAWCDGSGGSAGGDLPASGTKLTVSGADARTIDTAGVCNTTVDEDGDIDVVFVQDEAKPGQGPAQLTFHLKPDETGPAGSSRIGYDAKAGYFQGYSTDTGTTDPMGYPIFKPSYDITATRPDAKHLRGTLFGTFRPPNAEQPMVKITGAWRCEAAG